MKPVLWLSKYRALSRYVIAQSKVETDKNGDYTSRFYRELHNVFGMKGADRRRQLGRPSTLFEADGGNPMQRYRSDIQSLRDLFIYFDFTNFPRSVPSAERYVRELKIRKYFTLSEEKYFRLMQSKLK